VACNIIYKLPLNYQIIYQRGFIMKRLIILISIMLGLLLSSSAYAGMVCSANNARGVGPWYGRSCALDPTIATNIATSRAVNACQISPGTLNPATCVPTGCSFLQCANNVVSPPPVAGPVFTCTAVGQYGHTWQGSGPDVTSALGNALAVCRNNGGINCQASASSCVAQ
jgi:hypothetical protein